MSEKKDYSFILLLIILSITIIFDAILTYGGINSGLNESNPIILFIFKYIGVKLGLVFVFLISLIPIYLLNKIRMKLSNQSHICWLYLGTSCVLAWRMYIVGVWVGLLNSII